MILFPSIYVRSMRLLFFCLNLSLIIQTKRLSINYLFSNILSFKNIIPKIRQLTNSKIKFIFQSHITNQTQISFFPVYKQLLLIMDSTSSDRHYPREDLTMREAFEQIYKHKLKQIQQFYSQQNKSLKKTLEEAYKKVLSDELLITMIGDRTTSKFIQDRVEQCFQNIVYNEREIIIQNQSIQITQLKFRLQEMTRNLEKMTNQNMIIQNNTHRQKAAVQGKYAQILQELNKKTQELKKSNLRIKQMEKDLTQKDEQLSNAISENEKLKRQLEQFDQELKNNIDANIENFKNKDSQLNKYRQTVQKLQKKLKQTQESLQDIQIQSKKTISEYKTKLEHYKQKMTQLINSTQNNKQYSLNINKSSVVIAPSEMQKRLAETIKQNEKRFQMLKQQKEKQRNELQRKYQSRQRQTQQYYQKLLQKKVAQVENQASEFWQNIKKQQASLRQLIKQYEQNYISNQEHERLMKEREELIFKMKEKMEDYQGIIEDSEQKVQQLSKAITKYEATLEERVNQIQKLQASLVEQITLTKKYQGTILQLKGIIKRTEQKLISAQEEIQRQSSKLTTQQSTNIKSSQDINFYQKQIKEKELKCKELSDLVEDQQRKTKKLQNELMIVNGNYNEIQSLFKENKRVLAELEFKIKQLEHDAQLTTNEYTHKIKKITQQVGAKSQEINSLTSQYKTIQQDYLSLKSAHTELQTTNKKLSLQIKYIKDTDLTIKEDYNAQITDLKARINQKNTQIEYLKNEVQVNHGKHLEALKEQVNSRKSAENKLKDYKKTLGLLQKLINSLLVDTKKQIDMIKTQFKNSQTIFESQLTLHSKTFAIQSIQIIRNIDHSSNEKLLKENQKFQQERKLIAQKFAAQKSQIQKLSSILVEKEKQRFGELIQQKDKNIIKLEGDLRAMQFETERKKQEITQCEKTIQSLQNKLIRQQEQSMKKIRQLSNEFEVQKTQLIEQYQEKRDITANELQELCKTIQKLKIQMENAKSTYDQEKLQISSQLRSIQDQQHVVKETAYRKDQELKRLDEQLRRTVEQRNHLEHTLRELSQNDQRKMMRIHELEFMENQLTQSLNLVKVKLQRTQEENSLLKHSIKENEETINKEIKNRVKVQNELKDIKAAIDRNDKFRDLRALQQMTVETQELTNKVNQMKRMSQYLDRTPLRS